MRTPSRSFTTQPFSPIDVAARYTNGRNPTPWTAPRTSMRRRRWLGAGAAMAGSACALGGREPVDGRVEPLHPGVEALARLARQGKNRDVAVHHAHTLREEVEVVLEDVGEIPLVDHDDVGAREDTRVLVCL